MKIALEHGNGNFVDFLLKSGKLDDESKKIWIWYFNEYEAFQQKQYNDDNNDDDDDESDDDIERILSMIYSGFY